MCVFLCIMCSEKLLIIGKNCQSLLKIVSVFSTPLQNGLVM